MLALATTSSHFQPTLQHSQNSSLGKVKFPRCTFPPTQKELECSKHTKPSFGCCPSFYFPLFGTTKRVKMHYMCADTETRTGLMCFDQKTLFAPKLPALVCCVGHGTLLFVQRRQENAGELTEIVLQCAWGKVKAASLGVKMRQRLSCVKFHTFTHSAVVLHGCARPNDAAAFRFSG